MKPIEWRDIAIFAVAIALLFLAAATWSADRYQFAPDMSGSLVKYAWRMDKRTGELCVYRRGIGLDCSQPADK